MPERPNIDIRPDHWEIVRSLLQKHVPQYEVWAFGSRAKWTAKDYSDLDLAVITDQPIALNVSAGLSDDFSESDLPWKVDVVDWATTSESFRKIIARDKVVVQSPGSLRGGWGMGSNEFTKVRFRDLLVEPVRNGIYKEKSYHGRGCKIVNMGELFKYPRMFDVPMKRVELSEKELSKSSLQPDDLLFARRSLVASGAGRCAIVKQVVEATTFESSIIRARPDPQKVCSDYLFYYFASPLGRECMGTILRQVAVSGITGSDLMKLEVDCPSLPNQVQIAKLLSALDDRITLLRETNATLEAIAQALFKSWFVDFDPVRAKMEGRSPEGMDEATAEQFPDAFMESESGLVPEGWGISTVGESFVLTMGQSPPGDTYSDNGDGLPFYQGRTDFGFRFPTKRMYCSAPTRIAEVGDTLVSVRAPVGDVNMAIERCCIGRGVASVRHPRNYRSFTFYAMRGLGQHFENFDSEGTIFGSINKKDFQTLPVIAPTQSALAAYDAVSSPIDSKIVENEEQMRTLGILRDTLLPRLISGQLRLPEAQTAVAEMSLA